MSEDQKKTYIGVKRIEAYPEDRDGQPGYAVIYPDGYVSWSPKAVFEAAYFPIDRPDKLTENDINRFLAAGGSTTYTRGQKTTVMFVTLPTGFEEFEASSCVDPKNYDENLGAEICRDHIKTRLWKYLGFLLQWATHGLKAKEE